MDIIRFHKEKDFSSSKQIQRPCLLHAQQCISRQTPLILLSTFHYKRDIITVQKIWKSLTKWSLKYSTLSTTTFSIWCIPFNHFSYDFSHSCSHTAHIFWDLAFHPTSHVFMLLHSIHIHQYFLIEFYCCQWPRHIVIKSINSIWFIIKINNQIPAHFPLPRLLFIF